MQCVKRWINWMSVWKKKELRLEIIGRKCDWKCARGQIASSRLSMQFIAHLWIANKINETNVTFSLPFWHTNCYFVEYFYVLISLNRIFILNKGEQKKLSTDWKLQYESRIEVDYYVLFDVHKAKINKICLNWICMFQKQLQNYQRASNGNFFSRYNL